MCKITIIILSYNTKATTERCLKLLINNLGLKSSPEAQIIVVDNNSQDGSQIMLKNIKSIVNKPKLKIDLLLNDKNLGFTKGNNQALTITKGEYVLFLNSDVFVNKISFSGLIDYLYRNPSVGALTVRLILPNGEIDAASHRGFPTIWNSFCYLFGLERFLRNLNRIAGFELLLKLLGGYHLLHLNLDSIHEIDSPSGAFFLTRKKILDEIHGFDERFFMYGEDLDLSYRIKKKGFKVVYYPEFEVLHLKRLSGLKTGNEDIRSKTKDSFFEAMKIFYQKHYEKRNFWLINKTVYFFIDIKRKIS